jgi:hypothetical protein
MWTSTGPDARVSLAGHRHHDDVASMPAAAERQGSGRKRRYDP